MNGCLSPARLPEGFRIALDPGLRRIEDGTVLVGGSPIRLLRLTPAGRDLVDRLAAGGAVPRTPAGQSLARRLLDAGLAHPRPPVPENPVAVAVVIPVRNDPDGMAATLAALAAGRTTGPLDRNASPVPGAPDPSRRAGPRHPPERTREFPTIVVDDLSSDPGRVAAASRWAGAEVIRRRAWGGPGAARNDGWRATGEPLVAFVDANCEPEPGWLEALLPHFADPRVAAVAPRIVPAPPPVVARRPVDHEAGAMSDPTPKSQGSALPRWLAAYEAVASPLDLGGREAGVRPRSPVPYVPTAALVVRRTALEELGGFDETLPVGEDVDFIWRLVAAGWTVRYEPRAAVRHPIRPGGRAWLRQRFRYGTSAAPLARRHGPAVAPAAVSPWTAAAWALVAAGHPVVGVAAAGSSVAVLAHRLPHRREAVRLAGIGHLRGGLVLARAVRRAWAPAAVALAVASRRSRPALAAVVIVPGLLEWIARRPRLDPARFVALGLADDLAYAAGVWAGCARERSARALRPDLRSASRHSVRQTYQPLSGSNGGQG